MGEDQVTTYRIVRFFLQTHRGPFVLRRGLSLFEARAYCADPQTSASTCTTPARIRYTRANGPWFDAWSEE